MDKIIIKRNTDGDTRVATKVPTIEEFEMSNKLHISDVSRVMDEISKIISTKGSKHDWTKVKEPYRSMFYRDLCNTIEGNIKFEDGDWGTYHYKIERHHLLREAPEDVNLLDVIEMIVDCVCAGMARSGEVRPLEIDENLLITAMNNTVQMVADMIEVE